MSAAASLKGLRVLLTGVNGFIGSHAVLNATQRGAQVYGLDLPESAAFGERVRRSLGGGAIAFLDVDLDSPTLMREAICENRIDIVLHLAASTRRDNEPGAWTDCVRTNTLITANVLAAVMACPESARPSLIIPGTQMEYGAAAPPWTEDTLCQPMNAYGASKLAATHCVAAACRLHALRACVLRLPLLFGPGQRPSMFIPEMIVALLRGEEFRMTSGEQRRCFLYAPDAANLLLDAGATLREGGELPVPLNAPSLPPIAIRDLAASVASAIGVQGELRAGALPQRPGEHTDAWMDSRRAERLLPRRLTGLEEALRQTARWYREFECILRNG